MTDGRIRVETEQFYQPRGHSNMTARERVIAAYCFNAGRDGAQFPWNNAANLAEERVALDAYEAGKAYAASLE